MTQTYQYLFPVLDTLLRNRRTVHLFLAIILGVWLGLFPIGTLQWGLSLISFLVLRINLLTFLITWTVGLPAGFLLDPVWNSLGFRFLTNRSGLYPLWGWMHHAPIIPFTEFNNTVVLGSTLAGLICAPALAVLFFCFRHSILKMVSYLWYQTKISRFYAHYRKN